VDGLQRLLDDDVVYPRQNSSWAPVYVDLHASNLTPMNRNGSRCVPGYSPSGQVPEQF